MPRTSARRTGGGKGNSEGAGNQNRRISTGAAIFHRTKLCMFYAQGTCNKGARCNFAHDESTLQPLPDLSCTKLCEVVAAGEECMDPDCRYAHTREEIRRTSVNKEKAANQPQAKKKSGPASSGVVLDGQEAAPGEVFEDWNGSWPATKSTGAASSGVAPDGQVAALGQATETQAAPTPAETPDTPYMAPPHGFSGSQLSTELGEEPFEATVMKQCRFMEEDRKLTMSTDCSLSPYAPPLPMPLNPPAVDEAEPQSPSIMLPVNMRSLAPDPSLIPDVGGSFMSPLRGMSRQCSNDSESARLAFLNSPSNLVIKNTFIDFTAPSPSAAERKARSVEPGLVHFNL